VWSLVELLVVLVEAHEVPLVEAQEGFFLPRSIHDKGGLPGRFVDEDELVRIDLDSQLDRQFRNAVVCVASCCVWICLFADSPVLARKGDVLDQIRWWVDDEDVVIPYHFGVERSDDLPLDAHHPGRCQEHVFRVGEPELIGLDGGLGIQALVPVVQRLLVLDLLLVTGVQGGLEFGGVVLRRLQLPFLRFTAVQSGVIAPGDKQDRKDCAEDRLRHGKPLSVG